jgi:DNA modification methylase
VSRRLDLSVDPSTPKASLVRAISKSAKVTFTQILKTLLVAELRTICARHSIASNGASAELIGRIAGGSERRQRVSTERRLNSKKSLRVNEEGRTTNHIRRVRGDARDLSFLHLEPGSIDLIVTSPPYWRRRDYGHNKQLGQESSPEQYVAALVLAMGNWAKYLRPTASVFLNLGDTYRKGFLAGIPALFEIAAREAGWNAVNYISWTKSIGLPEPRPYRLANRHESVFHLTRAKEAKNIYFDIFALAQALGQTANPGDTWDVAWPSDVWQLHPARSRSEHLAPFPPDLARRAILLACPERVCATCKHPYKRKLKPTIDLDPLRQQSRRAMELAKDYGLTEDHFAAIRAVGISDAGNGKKIQRGAELNTARVRALAAEAKEILGGYFREFTFAPKRHAGWTGCKCGSPTMPGTVLDPFMGSGTTLLVAESLGRNAIGVDLVLAKKLKKIH